MRIYSTPHKDWPSASLVNIPTFFFLWGGCIILFMCFLPLAKLPVSLRDFWFSKWAMIYGFAMVTAIFSLGLTQFRMPKIPKISLLLGLGVICWYGVSCGIHGISLIGVSGLDRLTFLVLSLLFFHLFQANIISIKQALVIITLSSLPYLVVCIPYIMGTLTSIHDYQNLAIGFGNINMSAEYVGVIFIFQMALLPFLSHKWAIRCLEAMIALSTVYCYLAQCRSIYMVFILSFFLLYLFGYLKKYPIYKRALIIVVASVVCSEICVILWGYLGGGTPDLIKRDVYEKDVSARYSLIMATLSLIRDHPWGVGPGQFEFSLLPYYANLYPRFNESLTAYSPHNEFLRWLAEDGIPYVLLLIGLVGTLIYHQWTLFKNLLKTSPLLPLFLGFLLIQCLFQFPFQNGIPFFVSTLVLGFALAEIYKNSYVIVPQTGYLKLAHTAVITVTLFMGGSIVFSEFLTYHYPFSSAKNQLAYTFHPGNWYSAIYKAHADFGQKNYALAKETLVKELKQRANNFVALSYLAQIHQAEGDIAQACTLLKKVDSFFNHASRHHDFIQTHCQNNGN